MAVTPRSLERCVEELAPRLLRASAGLVGHWPTAEDLAQDALTSLVLHWQRHGPPRDPAAFALTVLRRRVSRRWLQARALQPLDQMAVLLVSEDDPHQRTCEMERLERARRILSRLPRALRRTVCLRAAGFSLQEIASSEGCSLSAAKMRLHRARRAMSSGEGSEPGSNLREVLSASAGKGGS